MLEDFIRLSYMLATAPRMQRLMLHVTKRDDNTQLTELQVKALRRQLHPVDATIVQEICQGNLFGHLTEVQLVRLLPLLVQRRCTVDGVRLELRAEPLQPRVEISRLNGQMLNLSFGLQTADETWLNLQEGVLLKGSQLYFLQHHIAYRLQITEVTALATWLAQPKQNVHHSLLTPSQRHLLVNELLAVGVPEADLVLLDVQTEPPQCFELALTYQDSLLSAEAGPKSEPQVLVTAILQARYSSALVPITPYVGRLSNQQNSLPHTLTTTSGDVVERDVVAEEQARQVLYSRGFQHNRGQDIFVATGENALLAMDPNAELFPQDWLVTRKGQVPMFHEALALTTRVQMRPEQGLLDLSVDIKTGQDNATATDLIDMADLFAWLETNTRYVRLKDGSYVAPSANFRRSLKLLHDLGVDGQRVLVSPLCIGLLRSLEDSSGLLIADAATQTLLREIAEGLGPKPVDPPKQLTAVLRDYQRHGLDWLMMLHRHRLTGILADDMGLGKTLQTLALLALVREQEGQKPSLVVAPTSVVSVWRDEANRFVPDMQVVVWYGMPEVRHLLDITSADVVVTSYGILRRDATLLAKVPFRYVICDEAQSTKNAASRNAKAIRSLLSERRLALSGTPLENRPEELWSVFDFLAPGFLGSLGHFRKRYARPIARGETEAISMLNMRLAPLILRRLKSEVAKELPPKVQSVVRCEMGTAQRALYDHLAFEAREHLKKRIGQVGIGSAQIDILAALTRLRQICCDPSLLPVPSGTRVPHSAKLDLFEEIMREALASQRCVVVFSQFVQMQERLIKVIQRLGVKPLWLHGGSINREQIVANFQDPAGPPVIVVSLRAGGTGVTLTRADTVVHYDPWWNPAVERQATDRTHRLGQTKVINVYKLICARSIEERVLDLAAHKEDLARQVLGSEGGAQSKQITQDEVMALLS